MSTALRELMNERSTVPPNLAGVVRLGQVRRRIARTRRRRRASAAAGVAAVALAAVALVPGVGRTPAPTSTGSEQPALSHQFPEHMGSLRLLAVGSAELPEPEIVLSAQPTARMVALLLRCDPELIVEVRVGGGSIYTGGCGSGTQPIPVDLSAGLGVRAGTPLTFVVTPNNGVTVGFPLESRRPLPAEGSYALGVYERVFPATSPPVPIDITKMLTFDVGDASPVVRIDSSFGEPLATVSSQVPYAEGLVARVRSQGPGVLLIRANGVSAAIYDAHDDAATEVLFLLPVLDLAPGSPVIIDVEPIGMTAPWAVLILEQPQPPPR